MEVDWSIVKTQTLWSYEELIRKLRDVLSYNFVQEHYSHSMHQAVDYARKIRSGYLQDRGDKTAHIDNMISSFEKLGTLRIGTYSQLVEQVATREACLAFLQRTGFDFDQLVQTLNYVLRWVLPFKTPVREFIDIDRVAEAGYLEALKQRRIGSNLDVLEMGRTRASRLQFSSMTCIPFTFVTALVHKADISRLAYVRGKTIKHLCGGGYDTLDKIAGATLAGMEMNMDAYYRTLGKSPADFRSVIQLPWIIGGAQMLPRVVQDK